ncbi:MAG: hypothetical protein ABIN58_13520 [candidate division WOR-3 bacterium]
MASQIIKRLIQLSEELHQLLSCDQYGNAEIQWRLEWLQRVQNALQEASSREVLMELVQEMRQVMRGGMGAFLDIYLYPKSECRLSETEMNARFEQLTHEFYILREQLAKELEEN